MALTKITSQRKNRMVLTFDLEWVPGEDLLDDKTNPQDPETKKRPKERSGSLALRVCGIVDGPCYEKGEKASEGKENFGRYRGYATVADFLQAEMTKRNRGAWFYAHAGGSHDMEFVFDEIIKQSRSMGADAWKVTASFSGASAIIVHVTRGKNSWHFVDSYWLLRDGLASIGKAIGLPKMDEEKRKTKAETRDYYANVPLQTLVPYNQRDNVILWRAIDAFENTLMDAGGQLQMTIASCAMQLFRRKFLSRDIDTSHTVNIAARSAYFASRVEVFNTYAEDFLIYDINSSFPFSMTFPCPAALKGSRRTLPESDDEKCIYLADVMIEVPDMYAPPIPHRVGGRVFFPTGRWRSWLSSVDLRLLLRKGGKVLKVFEVLEFDYFEDLKEYALTVYEMRKNSETAFEKLVYKYLLNALYGKFAESPEKESILINPEKIDRRVMQMIMPSVWSKSGVVPVAHMHVPISVHITALARRTLYNHLEECENQKEAFHYCDSITGDRTVVLRDPDGRTLVEPVSRTWERLGDASGHRSSKEAKSAGPGWQALARDSRGRTGWFPLKKLIRHKTRKKTYLISSKRGQVRVTSDHSLVVGGREIKPKDFISKRMEFETLPAEPGKPGGSRVVDIFDSDVREARRRKPGSVYHGGQVENQVESSDGVLVYKGYRKPTSHFERFYRRGSPKLKSLLRVLGAYLSEGSSSLTGSGSCRDMFSLCQNKKPWLDALKRDLKSISKGIGFWGPKWSAGSKVYVLRSGAGFLPFLFTAMAGSGSFSKRLPSFVYDLGKEDFLVLWRKMVEGDGWVDPNGRDSYTTSSQELAAGLSYALSQHGFEHSIHYRHDKRSYSIRLRPDGSERARWTTNVEVGATKENEYVYDLEVEGAHTFVDGLGRVLLHNTDSIATRAKLPTGEKLGALKLEKKITQATFKAPKVYMGDGYELQKDGSWTETLLNKAKGFSLPKNPQEARTTLLKIIEGGEIEVQRMARMRELYRMGTTEPVEVIIKKALTGIMLSKRFHYPDGTTRPWTIDELYSGNLNPVWSDIDPFTGGKKKGPADRGKFVPRGPK